MALPPVAPMPTKADMGQSVFLFRKPDGTLGMNIGSSLSKKQAGYLVNAAKFALEA